MNRYGWSGWFRWVHHLCSGNLRPKCGHHLLSVLRRRVRHRCHLSVLWHHGLRLWQRLLGHRPYRVYRVPSAGHRGGRSRFEHGELPVLRHGMVHDLGTRHQLWRPDLRHLPGEYLHFVDQPLHLMYRVSCWLDHPTGCYWCHARYPVFSMCYRVLHQCHYRAVCYLSNWHYHCRNRQHISQCVFDL